MTRFMLRNDRLAPTAMAVVALLGAIAVLGWSSYFYSARSFESRDRERRRNTRPSYLGTRRTELGATATCP